MIFLMSTAALGLAHCKIKSDLNFGHQIALHCYICRQAVMTIVVFWNLPQQPMNAYVCVFT